MVELLFVFLRHVVGNSGTIISPSAMCGREHWNDYFFLAAIQASASPTGSCSCYFIAPFTPSVSNSFPSYYFNFYIYCFNPFFELLVFHTLSSPPPLPPTPSHYFISFPRYLLYYKYLLYITATVTVISFLSECYHFTITV